MNKGSVTLVGAGPGDPGLLTISAVGALKEAQVVLADRLVGPGVLAMIPPSAQVVEVGKESGNHTVPQGEINRLLLDYARQGKRVVRLKGGDPYLFGRGAEELEAVRQAGIPFRVVPGISASLAVPAYGGIPVTHRDYSSSVHILTGHAKAGASPDIDFESLVQAGGTYVFMMGFAAMENLLDGLQKAGLPPGTPAALIQQGTLPGQRKAVATAETLPQRARALGMSSPAVLVVGEVCALSEELDWFSTRPLFGKTVLVTRPASAGSELADRLEGLGAGVIPFPCIQLERRANTLNAIDLGQFSWLVFTSAFGADTFFAWLRETHRDIRALAGVKLAAIGSRTAAELEKRGLLVDYVPEVYDAGHLARGLAERVQPGERALLFRAAAGTPELPEILQKNRIDFVDFPAYDTLYGNPAAAKVQRLLKSGQLDMVTFTSASTVEGFVQAVGKETVREASFTGICIGEETAKRARAHGITPVVSSRATLDSMVETIMEHIGGSR